MSEPRIVIWHSTSDQAFSDGLWYRDGGPEKRASVCRHIAAGGYSKAGEVAAPQGQEDLDLAFARSQNGRGPWAVGHRSTCVGDVFVLVGDGNTRAFVVGSTGFDPLTGLDAGQLAALAA